MRVVGLLLFCVVLVQAEEPGKNEVVIKVDKEMMLSEFLDVIEKATERPLLYNPNGQRIRNQKMGSTFETRVPPERLFDTMRAILSFYELTLVPVGPKGYEIYLVIDSRSTNNFVKNKATFIDASKVPDYADRDGLYVATLLKIKHVENLTTLRTALSTMVSPAGIGRVFEVTGVGIIIMDFAPQVAAMQQVVVRIDQPSGNMQTLATIPLRRHRAHEMAKTLQDLFTDIPNQLPTRGVRRGIASWAPTPRIVAFKANNSIVVRATNNQVEQIRAVVASLEGLEVQDAKVDVIRLMNVRAAEMQAVLNAALRGPASPDREVWIVSDPHTNSLLIAGDYFERAVVRELTQQLDTAPRK